MQDNHATPYRSVHELLGADLSGAARGPGGSLALPVAEEVREVVLAAHAALASRACSRHEMQQRLLRKGYPAGSVQVALAWLTERGLLDDEAFAAEAVRSQALRRRWGRAKVARWLEARGVDDETAEQAWQEAAAASEGERAAALAASLGARGRSREQIFRFLMGRGYAADEARRAAVEHGAPAVPLGGRTRSRKGRASGQGMDVEPAAGDAMHDGEPPGAM